MLGSIRYNLSHLLDFSGRDARQTFWFYVLFLFIVQFLIGMGASVPLYVSIFNQAMEVAQNGADQTAATAIIVDDMVGAIGLQVWVSAITSVILVAMLAASFVRRLHDAGYTGWIAAAPAVIQIFAAVYSVSMIDRMEELMRSSMMTIDTGASMDPMAMQAEMGPASLIGWIGIVIVIGFGVLKSADGPNKYGDEPVRF